MKKSIGRDHISLSTLILACLAFFCPVSTLPAESAENSLSLAGTLWATPGFGYVQFFGTHVTDENGTAWREAAFHHHSSKGKPAYIWRIEGSKIYMRERNSSDRWDCLTGQIVDNMTILLSFYSMPREDGIVEISTEYDITRVVDPLVLNKYDAELLPSERIWNLKRDDFSLKKTLWKYQSDDGDNYIHYLSFNDDALYYFRSYNQVDKDSWRQNGRKVSFSVHGEYEESDYEGEFIDWATIKGTYRNRKSPGGKAVGFKLFRIIDPGILERYVAPYHRTRAQAKDMHAVLIDNPNSYSVLATVRYTGSDSDWTGMETTWNVPAKSSRAQRFPNGEYEIYFKYSNEPKAKYQGDNFSIYDGGVEIRLVSVTGGNYGIRRVN